MGWGKIFLSPLPTGLAAHKWFQHGTALWKATLTSTLLCVCLFFTPVMPVNFLLESVLRDPVEKGGCWAAARTLCSLSNHLLLFVLQRAKFIWRFLPLLLEIHFFFVVWNTHFVMWSEWKAVSDIIYFVSTLLLMKFLPVSGERTHFLSSIPAGGQKGLLFLHLLHWRKGERQHNKGNKACVGCCLKLQYFSGVRNTLTRLCICWAGFCSRCLWPLCAPLAPVLWGRNCAARSFLTSIPVVFVAFQACLNQQWKSISPCLQEIMILLQIVTVKHGMKWTRIVGNFESNCYWICCCLIPHLTFYFNVYKNWVVEGDAYWDFVTVSFTHKNLK